MSGPPDAAWLHVHVDDSRELTLGSLLGEPTHWSGDAAQIYYDAFYVIITLSLAS